MSYIAEHSGLSVLYSVPMSPVQFRHRQPSGPHFRVAPTQKGACIIQNTLRSMNNCCFALRQVRYRVDGTLNEEERRNGVDTAVKVCLIYKFLLFKFLNGLYVVKMVQPPYFFARTLGRRDTRGHATLRPRQQAHSFCGT